MPKICVLGSNSFSGQDFVDLMLDDPENEVIGISRSEEKPDFQLAYKAREDLSRFRFCRFDMNHDMAELLDFLNDERPSHIVNFAAQSEVGPSWNHPEHWFQTNCASLSEMVNALVKCNWLERYLHVSSPEAYGSCEGTVTEDSPDYPTTPYAVSKHAADMILDVYRRQFGFPVLTVRATNVYGARQQLFKIVNRTIINYRLGKKTQLHGGGKAVKSYIHVRDVSRGERAMLFDGQIGLRYHLSPRKGISIKELVRKIITLMDGDFRDATEPVDERPGQDAIYVIDSSRARETLGWTPQVSLDEGIRESIEWVDTHWDAIRAQSLDYVHKP